jgi:hypothetical protein
MTHPYDQRPARDQVETALEASCGLLMTLETIRNHAGDSAAEFANAQALLAQAIESLREAITEVRMARGAGPIALGFVAEPPVDRGS